MQTQKWQKIGPQILLLVLCGGALAWAWRHLGNTNPGPTTIDALISQTASGDVGERKLALQQLQPTTEVEATAAVDACTRALKDSEAGVRAEAAMALGRMAGPRPPVPGALAPESLRGIAPVLGQALKDDPDMVVRASAATGLASIYDAVVKSGTAPESMSDADPLKPQSLVAQFDAGLRADPSNRVSLIKAIERLGPLPMDAPPGLLSALDDESASIRGMALLAIANFSGGVDPAVPVLLEDVAKNTDRFPPDYGKIARNLRPSPAAVPALSEALTSKNGVVASLAASLLARIAPPPKAAAPAVIAAVKAALAIDPGADDGGGQRPAGGEGGLIAGTGNRLEAPPAGSVSPDLAITLARIAPPSEAMPLLLQVLKRPGAGSRAAAADGLAEMGTSAHPAVPDLLARLNEATKGREPGGDRFGPAAARALGRIVPGSPEAQAATAEVIAALSAALKAGPTGLRAEAARALGAFGAKAAPAVPRLKELAKDRITPVREAAEAALKQIEASPVAGAS